MHHFIESSDNVLALKLSGTITGDDFNAIMDRVDDLLAKHDNIHIFMETHAIAGLQLSALPHHVSRALPLVGKLCRFGRLAVVADQAWMRIGTRLESALLPSVSYRVFEPDRRDDALAWVEQART